MVIKALGGQRDRLEAMRYRIVKSQRELGPVCQPKNPLYAWSERTQFQGRIPMHKVSLLNCFCIFCFIRTDNERKTGCINTQKGSGDRLESLLLLAPIS